MSDLAARFTRLADEYEHRKAAATATVARWAWYTWPGLALRPLHFERDLLKPGRRLDARPPLDHDALRIGFDAEGRAVMTEEYSGFLHGRLYYETFVRHDGDVVEAVHFDAGGGPIYLHEYRFVDGLMRSADMVARHGSGRESYAYADGRITRVEIEDDGRPRAVLQAEHDDHGLVRIVEAWGAGEHSETRYDRPPAGFDLEAACRAVEDALVALVPDAVARLAVDSPAACVALSYQEGDALAFYVCVGTADERTEIDAETVWSPADFGTSTNVDLDGAGPLRLVRQELALLDADDREAGVGGELSRRLLCAVAARLNRRDWAGILPVTDDFVVYAVDYELVDLDRNLADSLPPDRLAQLRKRDPL